MKILKYLGWTGIIIQLLTYISSTFFYLTGLDNSVYNNFEELPLKYGLIDPLLKIVYGIINLSSDHFLFGLAALLGGNAFIILGLILVILNKMISDN